MVAQAIRDRYALSRPLECVSCEALEADPGAFHLRHIETEGIWTLGFERNDCARACLTVASPLVELEARPVYRAIATRIRARGIWRYQARGMAFGHLAR